MKFTVGVGDRQRKRRRICEVPQGVVFSFTASPEKHYIKGPDVSSCWCIEENRPVGFILSKGDYVDLYEHSRLTAEEAYE